MPAPVRLSKAPITEAIFDIRVQDLGLSDIEPFLSLSGEVGAEYAKTEKRQSRAYKVDEAGKPELVPEGTQMDGVRFISSEANRIAQFRLDGFTLNQLEPYTSWDEFSGEAFRLWEIYKRVAGEYRIIRAALRYINRLEFSGPNPDLDEFLSTRPAEFPGAPKTVSSYLVRIKLALLEEKLAANLTQSIEPNQAGSLVMTFDIDVYASRTLRDSDLRSVFERIRVAKNKLFFDSITDRTVELYK